MEAKTTEVLTGPGPLLPEIAMDDFPRVIDHTLLKPDATPQQIEALCDEALKYHFKASKLLLISSPYLTMMLF